MRPCREVFPCKSLPREQQPADVSQEAAPVVGAAAAAYGNDATAAADVTTAVPHADEAATGAVTVQGGPDTTLEGDMPK